MVHAYHMPVPRAPGILGPHPAGPQAHLAAAPYQAGGGGHAPGGFAPGGYALGGYAPLPAPASFGYAPPPAPAQPGGYPLPPAPSDPALLAALHSAPSPSNYGGGGDWYMDTGATAHMTLHPVKNLVSVRRLARDNPPTVEFDGIGFSVKDACTRMVPPSAADSALHDGVSDADSVQPPAWPLLAPARLLPAPPGAASARPLVEGPSDVAPAAGPSTAAPSRMAPLLWPPPRAPPPRPRLHAPRRGPAWPRVALRLLPRRTRLAPPRLALPPRPAPPLRPAPVPL
nr:vegetative cell wall protein gp1-like [Aegilops tauschii subsp. strangulata]